MCCSRNEHFVQYFFLSVDFWKTNCHPLKKSTSSNLCLKVTTCASWLLPLFNLWTTQISVIKMAPVVNTHHIMQFDWSIITRNGESTETDIQDIPFNWDKLGFLLTWNFYDWVGIYGCTCRVVDAGCKLVDANSIITWIKMKISVVHLHTLYWFTYKRIGINHPEATVQVLPHTLAYSLVVKWLPLEGGKRPLLCSYISLLTTAVCYVIESYWASTAFISND